MLLRCSTNLQNHFSKHFLFQIQQKEQTAITSEQLQRLLENVSLKKFAKNKLTQISDLAANSFGLSFCKDSFSLQLKLLLEQIKFIEGQVLDVENEMDVILEKINSPITTIPGIGNITAATILGGIGRYLKVFKCF